MSSIFLVAQMLIGYATSSTDPPRQVGVFFMVITVLGGFVVALLGCGGIGSYYKRRVLGPALLIGGWAIFGLGICCGLLTMSNALPHWLWWLP